MKGEHKMEKQNSINNKYQMNTLNISFPYAYINKAIDMNWYDIFFAIENGFLSYQAAIEHASLELGRDESAPQAVLDLAILSYNEALFPNSIHPYIDELANQITEKEKIKTKDKIMYVLLKWVYEHRSDYDDPLRVIEFIYDDFNFPKTIASFVRYLPMQGSNLGSIEKNTSRLFEYWKQFLNEQHKKWKEE